MTLQSVHKQHLRAFVISPDSSLTSELIDTFSAGPPVMVVRQFAAYPEGQELARLVRIYVPNVIFLSAASPGHMADVLKTLREEGPNVQVVAIHNFCSTELLLAIMRMGLQEFLSAPFRPDRSADCLNKVGQRLLERPAAFTGTDRVFSFLPAKQGVGATTVAVNTAASFARLQDDRVFLGDFDLNGGLVRFLLSLHGEASIIDAVERCEHIDESMWPQIVNTIGNMDVVHSGRLRPDVRLEPVAVRRLIEYVRKAYRAVFADLSGNLERYSIEIMRESKRIFLVTTPEIPALHLAREKERFLTDLDLGDRIMLVLNRAEKKSVLSTEEIESIVGRPVEFTLVNDYKAVHLAVTNGRAVDPRSELGRDFQGLAGLAMGTNEAPQKRVRRFVNYFSLVPTKYQDLLRA